MVASSWSWLVTMDLNAFAIMNPVRRELDAMAWSLIVKRLEPSRLAAVRHIIGDIRSLFDFAEY